MCIRDSSTSGLAPGDPVPTGTLNASAGETFEFVIDGSDPDVDAYLRESLDAGVLEFTIVSMHSAEQGQSTACLLYTSDAAHARDGPTRDRTGARLCRGTDRTPRRVASHVLGESWKMQSCRVGDANLTAPGGSSRPTGTVPSPHGLEALPLDLRCDLPR